MAALVAISHLFRRGPFSRAQAFVSLNWVLTEEPLDLATELGLDFLDYLLVRRAPQFLLMLFAREFTQL